MQFARRVGRVAATLFPCQSINYYLAAAVVGGKMWAESTPHGPTLVNFGDFWDPPMDMLLTPYRVWVGGRRSAHTWLLS